MVYISLMVPDDVRRLTALRAKERRLLLNISQKELADWIGVSLSSIKRFEQTGLISYASLLEIALALGNLDDFKSLFANETDSQSLFRPEPQKRQRSRKRKENE